MTYEGIDVIWAAHRLGEIIVRQNYCTGSPVTKELDFNIEKL